TTGVTSLPVVSSQSVDVRERIKNRRGRVLTLQDVAERPLRRRLQRRPIAGGAALRAWRLIGDEHYEAGNVEKGHAILHNAVGRSDRLRAGRADRIGRRLRGQ